MASPQGQTRGSQDPVVSERGQRFGNFPKAIRLVSGRGGRRKLGGLQKLQEPG